MNHRTPAEDFRARLAALSREQLEQAMHYLRARCEVTDPGAVDRALELVTMPVGAAPAALLAHVHVHLFGQDGICTECGTDIATWSREGDALTDAELDHIEGTL